MIQDWFTNLTIGPKKLGLPECLQGKTDLGFDVEKDPIEVHTGFYDYLDKSFDHVTKNLADIYEQYSDFELFVTGHRYVRFLFIYPGVWYRSLTFSLSKKSAVWEELWQPYYLIISQVLPIRALKYLSQ